MQFKKTPLPDCHIKFVPFSLALLFCVFFLAHLFLALCEKTTGPKASCKNLNKVILANGTRKNVMSLNIATGQRASCDVPDELAIPMNRTDHCSAIDMRADAPLWSGHQRHIVHHSKRTVRRNAAAPREDEGSGEWEEEVDLEELCMTSSRRAQDNGPKPWKERFSSFTPKTQCLGFGFGLRLGLGLQLKLGATSWGWVEDPRARAATLTDEFHNLC